MISREPVASNWRRLIGNRSTAGGPVKRLLQCSRALGATRFVVVVVAVAGPHAKSPKLEVLLALQAAKLQLVQTVRPGLVWSGLVGLLVGRSVGSRLDRRLLRNRLHAKRGI